MKKQFLTASLFCLTLLLASCGGRHAEETTPSTQAPAPVGTSVAIEYSNLSSQEDQEDLARLMDTVQISRERQEAFFDHVDQINALMTQEQLTQGYEMGDSLLPKYDPYDLQDAWDQAYPEFMGYNCRITAFTLFGDFVEIPEDAATREDELMFDLESLLKDPSAFPGQEQAFAALFSSVPTGSGTDPMEHLHAVQADWAQRGITFVDDPGVRLISVFFHDTVDPNHPVLSIGHTGVLFPISSRELYFVEKLSFQEPYQCIRFTDRKALNEYLMGKYDVEYDQPSSPPFIMENDELMEGYRRIR